MKNMSRPVLLAESERKQFTDEFEHCLSERHLKRKIGRVQRDCNFRFETTQFIPLPIIPLPIRKLAGEGSAEESKAASDF
jgi:hypothetical protein